MTNTQDRQLPWDAMGGKLAVSKAKTVAAALAQKGLDYTVDTCVAMAAVTRANPSGLEAPGHQAIVRPMPDGTEKVLAFTGSRFRPIQNVDAFAPADYLVKEFGAKIVGAADYRKGDRSILVVKLPKGVGVIGHDGQEDQVDMDLIITNDHAGNGALTMALTPLRVSCTNALPASLKAAQRVWKVSHTPNAAHRLDLAAESMRNALRYADAFQAQAQAMMDQPMVDAEFSKMVAKLYPTKDVGDRAAEQRADVRATLMNLWSESDTITNIRGTRWAGYNVVTEYLDHYRPVRSEAKTARAEGALDGPYVRRKAALWGMFASA